MYWLNIKNCLIYAYVNWCFINCGGLADLLIHMNPLLTVKWATRNEGLNKPLVIVTNDEYKHVVLVLPDYSAHNQAIAEHIVELHNLDVDIRNDFIRFVQNSFRGSV